MSQTGVNQQTILVADDSEPNRDLFSTLLKTRGYQVVCAEDGDQALDLLRRQRVDLALLDVMMPGRTGFAVCRAVKADPKTRLIPVVLVTGLSGAGIASTLLVEGGTVTVVGIGRGPYPTATDRRWTVIPGGPWDLAVGPSAAAASIDSREPCCMAAIASSIMRSVEALRSARGGALGKLLPPFRLGLGGSWGNGHQWWSWVHVADMVGMITFLLERDLGGAVNVAAPNPVRADDFAKTLGASLGRPTFARVPEIALRVALGEAADPLLSSQRALPRRVQEAGYTFRFPELAEALERFGAEGAEPFYRGEVAAALSEFTLRGGGTLALFRSCGME